MAEARWECEQDAGQIEEGASSGESELSHREVLGVCCMLKVAAGARSTVLRWAKHGIVGCAAGRLT
jgi:hypothetical protein